MHIGVAVMLGMPFIGLYGCEPLVIRNDLFPGSAAVFASIQTLAFAAHKHDVRRAGNKTNNLTAQTRWTCPVKVAREIQFFPGLTGIVAAV